MTSETEPATGADDAEARHSAPGRRRRGRQAEAQRNDHLVLEAARAVFAEQGAGAPMAAVAQRAGVGIGTLYRRYGSKQEMLQHLCVLSMEQMHTAAQEALAEPSSGHAALAAYVRRCVALRAGALAPVAGTIPVTSGMTAASDRGRNLNQQLLRHAQADDTVRSDVTDLDVSYLIEHFGRRPRTTPEEDNVGQRLLTLALDGLRNHGQPALPGTPPSWHHYRARWYDPPP